MKLKIYIFRHGQTYYNKKHIFTGWKNSQLTTKGIRDAKHLANLLKSKKIDVAYHTRLDRSKDTLKHVLKHHPECKEILCDDRMIERSYGSLSGRSHKAYIHEKGKKSYRMLLHWHQIEHLYGKEQDAFIEKVGKAEFDIIHRSYSIAPPKGESVQVVEKRVNSFIKDLLKKMKKEKINVAISAHGNSMRPFRKYFEKLSVEEMMTINNPNDEFFEYTLTI